MMSDKLRIIFESDDLGLLDVTKRNKPQTSSDRLESSFLEIVDFYIEKDREPSPKTTDMAERKLGVRLRGIRVDDEKIEALKHLDSHGLLLPEEPPESIDQVFNDDTLGLFDDPTGILTLKNVPKNIQAAEYKARQKKCDNFDNYSSLFSEKQRALIDGTSYTIQFVGEQSIAPGEFFILKGVMVYVAEKSETFINKNEKKDARLRLIYENGTESDILMRTLARELYRNGSRIVKSLKEPDDGDELSGYIYVISSLSDNPKIANIANLYKIGYSTTSVEQRIKNAVNDPTYLMAPVKIVATYKAFNMNTRKFESLLHRVFADAKLNMDMIDGNGHYYSPNEWFIVPLNIIDMVVKMIISGDIVNYKYDSSSKSLVSIDR
jgi:hypothetical protein